MTKDQFHDSAKDKTAAGKSTTTTAAAPPRPPSPQPMMSMHLTPKPPFGMPVMPVATKVKLLPTAVQVVKRVEEDNQE